MTKVIADITMSLDGFVTGPDPDREHGLGTGGDALHTWAIDSDDVVDAEVLREATEATGAVVMGRRLFDIVDGPDGWDETMGYGAAHAATPPVVVVTHAAPTSVRLEHITFVTTGLADAIETARGLAGGKDVVVMGGGDVVRHVVDEGLADELRIHLAPLLLGAGTPLFAIAEQRDLVQREVRVSRHATHLTYELTAGGTGDG